MEQRRAVPRRGKVLDALVRAELQVVTRPAPKSAPKAKFQPGRSK